MSYAQNTISIAPMQENLKSPAQEFVESLIETYNPATVLPVVGGDGLYHFIYLTYHKETYKFYLGKHTTPSLEDGYLGSGIHFKRALKKHGSQSFTHVRLSFLANEEEAYKAEEKLITLEVIKKYREQLDVCYNLQSGGFGGSIYLSEETRTKQSQARKEAMANPEARAKMSQAMKEARAKPEVKAKMKEALSKPDVKAKHSKSIKEAYARPEVKAKHSKAVKEAMANPEARAKKSQAMRESWASPETRAKLSKHLKEVRSKPEYKAKQRQASKEAWANPEIKAKRKEVLAYKEIVLPSTGEKKAVHSSDLLTDLNCGWRLTSTCICLYKGTKRTKHALNLARWNKEREEKKEEAHLRLIRLLEDGWQVGCYPPEGEGLGIGSGTDGVKEARLEAWGDLMNFLAGL